MLSKPRTAEEAFQRLEPDLEELVDFIDNGTLEPHERVRLANLIAEHFSALAHTFARPRLHLAFDRSQPVQSSSVVYWPVQTKPSRTD